MAASCRGVAPGAVPCPCGRGSKYKKCCLRS
ncbi:SEC-C metal-binding domain-containing protein [Thioalkalivibrio sp.]